MNFGESNKLKVAYYYPDVVRTYVLAICLAFLCSDSAERNTDEVGSLTLISDDGPYLPQ